MNNIREKLEKAGFKGPRYERALAENRIRAYTIDEYISMLQRHPDYGESILEANVLASYGALKKMLAEDMDIRINLATTCETIDGERVVIEVWM